MSESISLKDFRRTLDIISKTPYKPQMTYGFSKDIEALKKIHTRDRDHIHFAFRPL